MSSEPGKSGKPGIEDLLRGLAPRVLGVVVRRHGDFAAAEDAAQEALIAAATQWPVNGIPDNPYGWLVQVAMRRMVDQQRSEVARRHREERAAAQEPPGPQPSDRDDTLILLFLCCHPTLTPASAIPLTLRAVGGLTTVEISKAFLVPEATMAQRISRAKQRIRGSTFQMPTPGELPERLRSVLHVLYLIFNEGYTASIGPELHRSELSGEAIRLVRVLRTLLPDNSEVAGLLALMLLTDARRPARTGPDGELIPLDGQDRDRWDRALITEGTALLVDTLAKGSVGQYQLQAAVAAVHDEAPSARETDWPQILALYGLLERMSDNPMVSLNRVIAAAMVHGPRAGLELLDGLDNRLAGHHRLHATRAHLLELAGDHAAAAEEYRIAAGRTASAREQHYLTTRAARLNRPDRVAHGLGRQTPGG